MRNFHKKIEEFKNKYPLDKDLEDRIPNPKFLYMGNSILEEAIAAILAGKNILWLEISPQVKTSLQKIWPIFLPDLCGIFLSM